MSLDSASVAPACLPACLPSLEEADAFLGRIEGELEAVARALLASDAEVEALRLSLEATRERAERAERRADQLAQQHTVALLILGDLLHREQLDAGTAELVRRLEEVSNG